MYTIVQETWLTKLVDSYGDSALTTIVAGVYASGLFKFCLVFFMSMAFIHLGLGIHKRTVSPKIIHALIAFLLLYPAGGKPIAYRLVDAMGTTMRYVFESGVNTCPIGSHGRLQEIRANSAHSSREATRQGRPQQQRGTCRWYSSSEWVIPSPPRRFA